MNQAYLLKYKREKYALVSTPNSGRADRRKEGNLQFGMSGSSFTRATPSRGGSPTGNSRVKMKRFIERLAFASEKAAHVARACRKETDLFKLLVQVQMQLFEIWS